MRASTDRKSISPWTDSRSRLAMVTRAARQGRGGPEIRGAGGVGLDVVVAGMVALAAGDHQALIALPGEGDPEGVQHRQGDVHIGPGHQLAGDVDFHPLRRQGPDEQEGGQVLTAHRPGQAGLAAREAAAPDNHRGTVIALLGGGRDPEISRAPPGVPPWAAR